MKKLAFVFRDSFAKAHKNKKLNHFKSLQHIYGMDPKVYKYLFNLPNHLGKASIVGAGPDQSLEWCLSNHSDIP
jgi:hypothetical protein